MADDIDFSQWTPGTEVRGQRSESVKVRNPLVPGGEGITPQIRDVQLDNFVSPDATPVDILAREGQESVTRRLQSDAACYTRVLSLLALGPRPPKYKPPQDRQDQDVAIQVAEILADSEDRYTRSAGDRLLTSTLLNSDLIVAIDDLESDPEEDDMSGKTKQGERLFRAKLTENTKVANVFWTVANDHRELDQFEIKNVAVKAVEAGYMVEAAKAKSGYKLTTSGETYYRKAIAKNLPKDFTSEKPLMTSTYYHGFPNEPRPNSNIVHVFWVVANDFRKLSERERRNVVYPAIAAGLIEKAPEDEFGFPRRSTGELSKCKFILTEDGKRYYADHVQKVMPAGFESREAPQKVNRQTDAPTSALKAT